MSVSAVKTYAAPPFCEREALRYCGCKTAAEDVETLLRDCWEEAKDKFSYRVCYAEYPLRIDRNVCRFGGMELHSNYLAKHVADCDRMLVFAATVGVEIDRLIAKYGRLSPSKAIVMQGIGTERIESLCDAFCADMRAEKQAFLTSRFSAGYGDLPLEAQREVFAALDCSKKIGVCLNESLLMSPSKSVTAFVGISDVKKEDGHNRKCRTCDKRDCAFRE